MDSILKPLGLSASHVKKSHNDDVVDRMNHQFTVALLILFAILVSTKQFVGDPITCWTPAHFTGVQDDYTNSYCWIRNTYHLSFDEEIPREDEKDKRHMIPYYQWMPMMLLVQALLYYLPFSVWQTLNVRSGIDVQSLVESGQTFTVTEMTEIRDKTLSYMVRQMDRYLSKLNYQSANVGCTCSLKNCVSRLCFRKCSRSKGRYLVVLYLGIKLLYIANAIGQIFLLDYFLGSNFHMYGIEVLYALSVGNDWTASSRFPRTAMCDFKIRRLGNVHRYTVQCVLPINLFNEKIYLLLWFWMVVLAAITCVSLLVWTFRAFSLYSNRRYIKNHLNFLKKLETDTDYKKKYKQFITEYLKQDGIFVLRLVGHNTNVIAVTEFVCSLYDNFKKKNMSRGDALPGDGYGQAKYKK